MDTYTLSTECSCETYDAENGEGIVPADECFGCYEDEQQLLAEAIDAIIEAETVDAYIVNTERARWTNTGQNFTIEATGKNVIDCMKLNGDYRIEFYLDGSTITARRWSHDEPTGTGLFTFQEANFCDNCHDGLDCECSDEDDDN